MSGGQLFVEQPLAVVEGLIGKPVTVITSTELEFDGILRGFDQAFNCVLEDVTERNVESAEAKTCHRQMTLINGGTISLITERAA